MATLVDKGQLDKGRAPAIRFLQSRIDPLTAFASAALVLAIPLHFIGLDRPLWLDEAATGGIAAQHSLVAVLRLTLYDVNAPLYYVLVHYWSLLFGLSDVALRLPSALAGAAAGWIVVASPAPVDRETKLVWAALLALWIPGLDFAQDARCYTLLFSLATLATLLFARLIANPGRKLAFAWAAAGLLAIFTHYHALLLIGAQGLALLAWHRGKALSLWPACLLFVPVPFWLALHLASILNYLDPRASWYWLVTMGDLPGILDFLADSALIAVFALVLLLVNLARRGRAKAGRAGFDPLWLVVLASLVPALFVIAIGFVRPSFTPRYLIVFAPGILLGLALIARDARTYWRRAPLVLLLMFAAVAASWCVREIGAPSNPYSFERASKSLIGLGAKRLVFFWDNPNSQVMDPHLSRVLGGFFFVQAGRNAEVMPVRLRPGEDPNERLIRDAGAQDAAILWVYDLGVHDTAARSHPPDIAERDPSWSCQNFGTHRFGIIACHRNGRS